MRITTNKITERAAKHMLAAHASELSNVQRQSLQAIVDNGADLRDFNRLNEASRICQCAEKEITL